MTLQLTSKENDKFRYKRQVLNKTKTLSLIMKGGEVIKKSPNKKKYAHEDLEVESSINE